MNTQQMPPGHGSGCAGPAASGLAPGVGPSPAGSTTAAGARRPQRRRVRVASAFVPRASCVMSSRLGREAGPRARPNIARSPRPATDRSSGRRAGRPEVGELSGEEHSLPGWALHPLARVTPRSSEEHVVDPLVDQRDDPVDAETDASYVPSNGSRRPASVTDVRLTVVRMPPAATVQPGCHRPRPAVSAGRRSPVVAGSGDVGRVQPPLPLAVDSQQAGRRGPRGGADPGISWSWRGGPRRLTPGPGDERARVELLVGGRCEAPVRRLWCAGSGQIETQVSRTAGEILRTRRGVVRWAIRSAPPA